MNFIYDVLTHLRTVIHRRELSSLNLIHILLKGILHRLPHISIFFGVARPK